MILVEVGRLIEADWLIYAELREKRQEGVFWRMRQGKRWVLLWR